MVLSLLLATASVFAGEKRFLERIRVVSVREDPAEITILDPDGETRVLSKGDRLEEEDATVETINRAHMTLTRGTAGEDDLIVVRFDASGKVKVREYSKASDSPQPESPPPDSFE